jgi:hypothetical protein
MKLSGTNSPPAEIINKVLFRVDTYHNIHKTQALQSFSNRLNYLTFQSSLQIMKDTICLVDISFIVDYPRLIATGSSPPIILLF